jgi:polysaccharide export outer membrane protein
MPETLSVLIAVTLACLLTAGCDTMPLPRSAAARSTGVQKPAVAAQSSKDLSSSGSAIVKPGFVVRVSVMASGKKELEEPAKRITDKGEISLPLLGTVHVAGLTLDEMTTQLNTLYTDYYNQPQVVVDFVKEADQDGASPWGYVTIMGRVVRPGRIPIPPTRDLTISGAIQQAGGFSTSAKDTAIRITRRKGEGASETFDVNLEAAGTNGHLEEDKTLQPGDVIFVPQKVF